MPLGIVKLQTSDDPIELPVFPTGDVLSSEYSMWRVETGGGTGVIPLIEPTDAEGPYLRMQTANHDVLSPSRVGYRIDDFETDNLTPTGDNWSDWAGETGQFDPSVNGTIVKGNYGSLTDASGLSGGNPRQVYTTRSSGTKNNIAGYHQCNLDTGSEFEESKVILTDNSASTKVAEIELEDASGPIYARTPAQENTLQTSWTEGTLYYFEFEPDWQNGVISIGVGTNGTIDNSASISLDSSVSEIHKVTLHVDNDKDSTHKTGLFDSLHEY